VIAPDQIGWGKSSKPDIHYSFQLLAANTAALLDHLGVERVAVLGHPTGGMTAARFTLMNPDRVTHLVLEDPLGLAEYRTGIPPQSEETLYQHELHWTDPAVIGGYVAGYFVHPDPNVWEPLADVLVRVTLSPDYPRCARAAALTCQMIHQQPVRRPARPVRPAGRGRPARGLYRAFRRSRARHSPRHPGGHTRLRARPAPGTARPFLAELLPFLAS
jgi:pimeloyl-ACP methyl ester carboxylesterase